MSSRQLRKLQQQRELEQAKLQAQAEEEEEESEDEPVVAQKPKPSLFANLAALEDEADEDEEESKEQESPEDVKEHNSTPTAAKKSKKSKKKKKAKAKEKAEEKETVENGDDEIEAALKELNIKDNASGKPTHQAVLVDPEFERVCTLLGINTNHLKVGNEMKNLFGKEALENLDDAGGPVPRASRRRQQRQQRAVDLETALKGRHAPGKGLSELTLRRNYLIQGKDDWPKSTTGGLTMELVDDRNPNGVLEFKYVHDKTYQATQQMFHGFVEMGDPQNLIGLLTRNPYHISLLIQVSKVAKNQGDHSLAADLLERALFTFGRTALSTFNTQLSLGKTRLNFSRPENREVWLAGYHYIQALVMKGTYRTALEWAKLLLSLSPEEDPYCMHLMIHHLAIRAHEFKWLLDFYGSTNPATWHPSTISHRIDGYGEASLTLATVQLRDPIKSREYLSNSMRTVPWLYTRLFKELDLDAPKTIWGIMPRTDAETLFTEIYVLQTKDLWNTTETTALLMEIAHTISKPDIDSIPLLDNNKMSLDVVRFVYLGDNPKIMALVPSKLLHRSNNSDSDPLPPDDNIFSYPHQRVALRWGERDTEMPNDFNNPLAALAQLFGGNVQLPGMAGPNGMSDEVRREMEAMMEHEDGDSNGDDVVLEDENGNTVPLSFARRLLDMFWRPRGGDDDDEDEDVNTDTDEEGMPELVPLEGSRVRERQRQPTVEDGDESDDDMPPLLDH